jgi:hypothetical protein
VREANAPGEPFPDLPTLPIDMTWIAFEEYLAPFADEAIRYVEALAVARLDNLWRI